MPDDGERGARTHGGIRIRWLAVWWLPADAARRTGADLLQDAVDVVEDEERESRETASSRLSSCRWRHQPQTSAWERPSLLGRSLMKENTQTPAQPRSARLGAYHFGWRLTTGRVPGPRLQPRASSLQCPSPPSEAATEAIPSRSEAHRRPV